MSCTHFSKEVANGNERFNLVRRPYAFVFRRRPNTIIRRPNVRRFAQENGVRHIICNGKWLIDYKEFFKKVNPRRIRRTATMPRLRCLRDCVTEFNKNNRKYKIDKATVSHYMNSAQVTRYFHGNTWFINYDELEKVILRHLKAVKKRKKRKYN